MTDKKEKYYDQFSVLQAVIDEWIADEYEYGLLKYDYKRNLVYMEIGPSISIDEGEWNSEEECNEYYEIPFRLYVSYDSPQPVGIRLEEKDLRNMDIHIPQIVLDFFIQYATENNLYIKDDYYSEDKRLSDYVEKRIERLEDSLDMSFKDDDKTMIFDLIDEDEWATLFNFHFSDEFSWALVQMYYILDAEGTDSEDKDEIKKERASLSELISIIEEDLKKRAKIMEEEYVPLDPNNISREEIEWAVLHYLDYAWGNVEPKYSLSVQHRRMWKVSRAIGAHYKSLMHFNLIDIRTAS